MVLPPKAPLAVFVQNNAPLWPDFNLRPECSKLLPLTHLIMHTNHGGTSLKLHSWNCSSGFVDLSDQIAPLTKGINQFLGVASNGGKEAYVQFDRGNGPEIEQWAVPQTAEASWAISDVVFDGKG
jgi:hypothetical protein